MQRLCTISVIQNCEKNLLILATATTEYGLAGFTVHMYRVGSNEVEQPTLTKGRHMAHRDYK